jgi:hypothetical protein
VALTAEQRLYVFEILDLPPGGVGIEITGTLGHASAYERESFGTPTSAVDELLALLTAEQEAIVSDLVDQWKLVRTSEVMLHTAEDVEGVVVSHAQKRDLIKRALLVHVPVYREGELVERHARGTPSNRLLRA